jgi:hypothetical protein
MLFHGSSQPLKGETLNPSQAYDHPDRPENNLHAVYATDRKDLAIVMAIIACSDVVGGSIDGYVDGKLNARIYGEYPKQEFLYVHYLPEEGFVQTEIDKHQFVCEHAVQPIKTEQICIADFHHLVRIATQEETVAYKNKYC